MIQDKSGFCCSFDPLIYCEHFWFTAVLPKDALIHFESDHRFNLIYHESVPIALYILFLLCFSFQVLPFWEDGVVLKRTGLCGTALSMDLPSSVISSGSASREFPGSGSGLIGCGTIFMVRDPILVQGMVPSRHFMNPITLLLAL